MDGHIIVYLHNRTKNHIRSNLGYFLYDLFEIRLKLRKRNFSNFYQKIGV